MHKTRLKTLQPSHCKANKIFYRILATFLHLQRARRSWNVLSVFLAKKADLLANPKDLPANREKTTHCHFSWIFWQIFGICWQIWIFFCSNGLIFNPSFIFPSMEAVLYLFYWKLLKICKKIGFAGKSMKNVNESFFRDLPANPLFLPKNVQNVPTSTTAMEMKKGS